MRPSIPSKYAGPSTQKVVYVSTKMPFMAAVKKVQKLLAQVEKRQTQSASAAVKSAKDKGGRAGKDGSNNLEQVAAALAEEKLRGIHDPVVMNEVVMKGTGKAIEKTLGLALWFQHRDEYNIAVTTGTVGAIDDIVSKGSKPKNDEEELDEQPDKMDVDHEETGDRAVAVKEGASEEDVVPESRVRYTSVLQVAISLVR